MLLHIALFENYNADQVIPEEVRPQELERVWLVLKQPRSYVIKTLLFGVGVVLHSFDFEVLKVDYLILKRHLIDLFLVFLLCVFLQLLQNLFESSRKRICVWEVLLQYLDIEVHWFVAQANFNGLVVVFEVVTQNVLQVNLLKEKALIREPKMIAAVNEEQVKDGAPNLIRLLGA